MVYRHVQWGFTAIPVAVLFAVILVPVVEGSDDEPPWLPALVVACMVGLIALVVYFSRLEVIVDDGEVAASFGIGRPRRVIPAEAIVSAVAVRNRWWYGWGVRRAPSGWLYNVWGLDAVEIATTDGTTFRIGTDEPRELEAVIRLVSATPGS
jgi:hypothetical protein